MLSLVGGGGTGVLVIQDETSTAFKPEVEVALPVVSLEFMYFDVENIDLKLGSMSARVNVISTAKDVSLTSSTGGWQFYMICASFNSHA